MSDQEIIPPIGQPKSFLVWLGEQRRGAVVAELSGALRDLIEAMEAHHDHFRGKVSGSISLNFKITLESDVYTVDTTYSVSRPKAPAAKTIMFLGHDGNLATENPKQLQMPFTAAARQGD